MRRVRVTVSGRVQGVGFRYAMAAEARRVGASGWVRNLRDGRVEAELEAGDAAVESLLAWLRHGPPGARLDALEVADLPHTGAAGFDILPSS